VECCNRRDGEQKARDEYLDTMFVYDEEKCIHNMISRDGMIEILVEMEYWQEIQMRLK